MTASGWATSAPPRRTARPSTRRPRRRAPLDGLGTHLERGLVAVAPERVEPDTDDRNVSHAWNSSIGADGRELERHDLVAVLVGEERDDAQLDLLAERELLGVVLGEAGLDADDVAELHEADTEGLEGGPVASRVGDFGGKAWVVQAMTVPRRGEQQLRHGLMAAAGQRASTGKVMAPQSSHRLPSSCGGSDGHV